MSSSQPSGSPRSRSVEELFSAFLKPPSIPKEANRGHFALLTGKLAAQEVCILAIAAEHLSELQRIAVNAILDKGEVLGETRLQEMTRLGQDPEAIAHAEGFLRGIRQLRTKVG